jgi:hypothetical protein
MPANDNYYQQSGCGGCRKNPEQELRAFTDRGHAEKGSTRNAKETRWFSLAVLASWRETCFFPRRKK